MMLAVLAAEPVISAPFRIRTMLVRMSWDAAGAIGWTGVRPTMRAIAERFADDCGVSLADLRGPKRLRSISRARQELMWLLRRQDCWSLPQIGRYLGCRDHTTILHGVRAHQKRLEDAGALSRAWTLVDITSEPIGQAA